MTEVESGPVVADRVWRELNHTGQREVVSRRAVVEILREGARRWVATLGPAEEFEVVACVAVRTWVHRDVVEQVLRAGATDTVAWLDAFAKAVEAP